jgi:hypothetical protein
LARNEKDIKFEQILLSSIDEALSILGENAKGSVYLHLENTFMMARQDIPYKVDDFSEALNRIFGLGARQLEILIMKKLHEKVNCQYTWEAPKWFVPDVTFKNTLGLPGEVLKLEKRIRRKWGSC